MAWWVWVGMSWATASGAVQLVGTDRVELQWEAATGPVAGYYLIISTNGAAPELAGVSTDTRKQLTGEPGETLVVQVAAFAEDGTAGPLSLPSEPLEFLAAPTPPPTPEEPPVDPEPDPPVEEPTPPADEPDPGSDEPPGSMPPASSKPSHDFSCDGTSDLIVRESEFRYVLWEIQDAGLVRRKTLPRSPVNHDLVGAGDYDGDGCADLLWQDQYTHRLTVWRLVDGKLASKHSLRESALPSEERWRVGGSGDVDGDGVDDIVLFSRTAGEAEIWLMDGNEVRDLERHPGRLGAWTIPALADADGDGRVEWLWYDELGLGIEHYDPSTGFDSRRWTMIPGWLPMGVAAFDGDGRGAALAHQPEQGGAAYLRIESEREFAVMLPNALELGRPVGYGDYDADGRDDIAWLDEARGVVTLALAGATQFVELDRALSNQSTIASALRSEDREFRTRLCAPDVDGNGSVDQADADLAKACMSSTRRSCAAAADLNGDGLVTLEDVAIVEARLSGEVCASGTY